MRNTAYSALVGLFAVALVPQTAVAQSGESFTFTGTIETEVVEPSTVQWVSDMRFGRFFSPAVISSIRIQPNGNITPSAGVAGGISLAQPPEGRGPAEFTIEQAGNRGFDVLLPSTITISNGTNTMLVNTIRDRLRRTLNAGRNSVYSLEVGGTLRIAANQQVGSYAGDFEVTVVYN